MALRKTKKILAGLFMKTPIYGLVASQPKDVYAYLREQQGLKNLLGTVTRSDGKTFETIDYSPVRANLTFTAIDGLDVVVSDAVSTEVVAFEDGTHIQYSVVTIYSAVFAGSSQSALRTEIERAGYTSQVQRNITEADYIAAVGGTGDYSAATSFHSIQVRAGAGRPVPAPKTVPTTLAEVGQGGAGGEGGYELTGGFADRLTGSSGANDLGTFVSYTGAMVDDERWLRFGFSSAANTANDNQYWGETDPDYDRTKGLFGGLHMPKGVNRMFDFSFNSASYSDASEGSLKYTAADGSIDFTECRVGDLALVRFDFNVIPQVANTTLEVAMIWQTRDANDNATFTFALTGEPLFYGTGTVGRTFLNRPMLSAYFASAEDVNARALLAIRSDNPIQVAPLSTLVTIVR